MNKLYIYIGAGIMGVLIIGGIWFLFFAGSSTPNTSTTPGVNFGVGDNRPVTVPTATPSTDQPVATDGTTIATKIFKIVDGPVAGATLLQMGHPTTTVARFVMQDSGHVFDLPLDSPGAVARAVSNTTMPGIATAVWEVQGAGATLQYLDTTIKTLHLTFPSATTTLGQQQAVKIQFLPNGITSLAISPDSKNIVFLLPTNTGSDGYVANQDGSGSKKLFSLPLSQITLSWPSAGTILAQTVSASGVEGVVFSIDTKSGATTPLIYATGLSVIADKSFNKVVYSNSDANTQSVSTYIRDTKTGLNTSLPTNPYPEKCLWSTTASMTLYCSLPLSYVPPNYIDLWHAGTASAADSIFALNISNGLTHVIATPGSRVDGGEQADILSMALSPDDKYLIYIRKGDRSLWGVRLAQ